MLESADQALPESLKSDLDLEQAPSPIFASVAAKKAIRLSRGLHISTIWDHIPVDWAVIPVQGKEDRLLNIGFQS